MFQIWTLCRELLHFGKRHAFRERHVLTNLTTRSSVRSSRTLSSSRATGLSWRNPFGWRILSARLQFGTTSRSMCPALSSVSTVSRAYVRLIKSFSFSIFILCFLISEEMLICGTMVNTVMTQMAPGLNVVLVRRLQLV